MSAPDSARSNAFVLDDCSDDARMIARERKISNGAGEGIEFHPTKHEATKDGLPIQYLFFAPSVLRVRSPIGRPARSIMQLPCSTVEAGSDSARLRQLLAKLGRTSL